VISKITAAAEVKAHVTETAEPNKEIIPGAPKHTLA
jgi:hypothetical protein